MAETGTALAAHIDAATAVLTRAGIDDPRREALRLWRTLGHSDAVLVDRIGGAQVAGFEAAVARRAAGEPFAYVVGSAGFRHLTLACDRRVLIPRPETEGLVDIALDRSGGGTVVDVGTGSGAIALSLRLEGRYDRVVGVDIARDALDVARTNAALAGASVDWVCGDLLDGVAAASADLVVTNPPYISSAEYAGLDRSVREHEPIHALLSGDDGLLHTRRLLTDASRVLRADGWMVIELDCRRATTTAEMAVDAGWQSVAVIDDLFGRARYLAARRG